MSIVLLLQGFFTALRLVAACQCGREPAIKSIMATDPPPKFVGLEHSIWSIEVSMGGATYP